MPEILERNGSAESREGIYGLMAVQQTSGILAVVLAVVLIRSQLGQKWTLTISLFGSGILLFSFLAPSYYLVRCN